MSVQIIGFTSLCFSVNKIYSLSLIGNLTGYFSPCIINQVPCVIKQATKSALHLKESAEIIRDDVGHGRWNSNSKVLAEILVCNNQTH